MKTKKISRSSKQFYWIAILIAVLVASMLPLSGLASPLSSGQAGYGQSTILKGNDSKATAKGVITGAFQAKMVVAAANTGSPQTSFIKPVALAVADLIDEAAITEDVVTEEVVAAAAEITKPAFVSLANFSQQVTNGNAGQITGIYSANLFALPVIQQPSGQAGYVSGAGNTATQFGMASGLGFLAHNYLSGSLFFYLYSGAPITVVYGDGHSKNYQVSQIRKFQALSPDSPYSDFVDLASGSTLSASDLFYATYGVGGQLVLQTCISANGNSSWGRLFVIATPGG
jgi:hypothetical protein